MVKNDEIRQRILALLSEFYDAEHKQPEFQPGVDMVRVSGKVFDADELTHLIDASLDLWLTTGRYALQFERNMAQFVGVRHAILCNSGSSANLLALASLTSDKLGTDRLLPGDEVITVAAGFPTTVNPIVQNGLVPVFVDTEPRTYNLDPATLENAISPRTRAIMVAHTLGNPVDLDAILEVTKKHDLWFIEDSCDALGSTYKGQMVGTFGDLATLSFYPAHHITMGEGGCVLTNRPDLKVLVESFRDWGRDCWCEPGQDNTCGKRFQLQCGRMPYGYDHKYVFSHIGYNLKATDMQAAVGVAQIKKLPAFGATRRSNFKLLYSKLKPFEEFLILPAATPNSDPSWFGFPITIREGAPFTRRQLIDYLEEHNIATRLVFAGNISRQPAYSEVRYRIVGKLTNTDAATERALWIGVYPGITDEMISYMGETFGAFIRKHTAC